MKVKCGNQKRFGVKSIIQKKEEEPFEAEKVLESFIFVVLDESFLTILKRKNFSKILPPSLWSIVRCSIHIFA